MSKLHQQPLESKHLLGNHRLPSNGDTLTTREF
jgi:hypothetical protein